MCSAEKRMCGLDEEICGLGKKNVDLERSGKEKDTRKKGKKLKSTYTQTLGKDRKEKGIQTDGPETAVEDCAMDVQVLQFINSTTDVHRRLEALEEGFNKVRGGVVYSLGKFFDSLGKRLTGELGVVRDLVRSTHPVTAHPPPKGESRPSPTYASAASGPHKGDRPAVAGGRSRKGKAEIQERTYLLSG